MSERGYVMLSYNWGHQEMVNKIRYYLWKKGYRVWIDISKEDGMKDFIYSDMANAVKGAEVVVCCVSQKYQESENCKLEGGCVGDYKKKRIALKMEAGYERGDWVQGLFGGRKYIDFSDSEKFEENCKELLDRLENYTTLNPQTDNPIPPYLPSPETAPVNPKSAVESDEQKEKQNPSTTTDIIKLEYKLSDMEYAQLLVNISSSWKKFGNICMLKVLLCDFNISIAEIERTDNVFGLFKLLRGTGKISSSNITVIAEAAVLCGLGPVKDVITKHIPTYQIFSEEINTFSRYRQNVIEFGLKVTKKNINTIMELYDVDYDKNKDEWHHIFELEINDILTPMKKDEFVEKLKANKMTREAQALNT